MDSGFGDDEAYTVYDKPWRDEHTVANNIYRPSKKLDSDLYGDDLDTLMKNKRSDMDFVFLLFLNRYWNSHLYKPYVQGFWLTAFKGRLASQFWSQNVPEQVFFFFPGLGS